MRRKLWLRRAAVMLVVLWAASQGLSWYLGTRRVHRFLVAHLEAAFGRPVEVGRFSFSLLEGARLEASSVTLAEDPRFGYEYFLRADSLTAGLHWRSLLRGRFEFGTLLFTRPSLNLVRNPDGHWNVESWLPPALATSSQNLLPTRPTTQLYRVEIDSGRINFKRGAQKHPFALVGVAGRLDQESAGRWRIDLEARPMRAGVILQDAGTLRLRGRVAGTSARLQPAELELTWEDVSLADALRLWRGKDYGIWGRMGVELTARTALTSSLTAAPASQPGPRWQFNAHAWVRGVHRWDLPPRPTDPALSLNVAAEAWPALARIELTQGALEAPQSNVQLAGRINWSPVLSPEIHLTSKGLSWADALAWYRSFRSGVAEGLDAGGFATAEVLLHDWPLRVEQGELAGDGATFRGAGEREVLHLGRFTVGARRDRIELKPVNITLPGTVAAQAMRSPPVAARTLRLEGALDLAGANGARQPPSNRLELRLSGSLDRAQDVLAAARDLGHPLGSDWGLEGATDLRLEWVRTRDLKKLIGYVDLRGARLRASFLNQPLVLTKAKLEFQPDGQRILTLAAAQGFGTHWSGELRMRAAGQPWEFHLAADRLDVAVLDRWLGPRARPSLLARLLPFALPNRANSESDIVRQALRRLAGRGQLSVDEVVLAPLALHRLRAELELQEGSLTVGHAQADFFGGTVEGSLHADFLGGPAYRFQGKFERVNLTALGDEAATLRGRLGGTASAEVEVAARGIGRGALVESLGGRGIVVSRDAELRGLDLGSPASLPAGRLAAEARFAIGGGRVRVEKLRLSHGAEEFVGSGSVSFGRAVEFQLYPTARASGDFAGSPADHAIHIRGSLDALQVIGPQR